jgi:hypothetical protein
VSSGAFAAGDSPHNGLESTFACHAIASNKRRQGSGDVLSVVTVQFFQSSASPAFKDQLGRIERLAEKSISLPIGTGPRFRSD